MGRKDRGGLRMATGGATLHGPHATSRGPVDPGRSGLLGAVVSLAGAALPEHDCPYNLSARLLWPEHAAVVAEGFDNSETPSAFGLTVRHPRFGQPVVSVPHLDQDLLRVALQPEADGRDARCPSPLEPAIGEAGRGTNTVGDELTDYQFDCVGQPGEFPLRYDQPGVVPGSS